MTWLLIFSHKRQTLQLHDLSVSADFIFLAILPLVSFVTRKKLKQSLTKNRKTVSMITPAGFSRLISGGDGRNRLPVLIHLTDVGKTKVLQRLLKRMHLYLNSVETRYHT